MMFQLIRHKGLILFCQISSIQSSPHGSQSQPPSAPGLPGSTSVFGPPPYVQSCNPPAPIQRLEANDKSSSQQHQQRSSSQPRPMSTTSLSLGSPNHLRPISPVSSALPTQGNLADKKSGTASKMSSSSSKAKKCTEEVNSIQVRPETLVKDSVPCYAIKAVAKLFQDCSHFF